MKLLWVSKCLCPHGSVEFPFSWPSSISSPLCLASTFCLEECRTAVAFRSQAEKWWPSGHIVFVPLRLLSMLTPPTDSWASCPSIKRSLWLLLLSKESSQAPNFWRTAYKVGDSVTLTPVQYRFCLMSCLVILQGVRGQPRLSLYSQDTVIHLYRANATLLLALCDSLPLGCTHLLCSGWYTA